MEAVVDHKEAVGDDMEAVGDDIEAVGDDIEATGNDVSAVADDMEEAVDDVAATSHAEMKQLFKERLEDIVAVDPILKDLHPDVTQHEVSVQWPLRSNILFEKCKYAVRIWFDKVQEMFLCMYEVKTDLIVKFRNLPSWAYWKLNSEDYET